VVRRFLERGKITKKVRCSPHAQEGSERVQRGWCHSRSLTTNFPWRLIGSSKEDDSDRGSTQKRKGRIDPKKDLGQKAGGRSPEDKGGREWKRVGVTNGGTGLASVGRGVMGGSHPKQDKKKS